jgi:hypothetical protein
VLSSAPVLCLLLALLHFDQSRVGLAAHNQCFLKQPIEGTRLYPPGLVLHLLRQVRLHMHGTT